MTVLALAAPTLSIGGALNAGLVLPVTEPGVMVSGNTGFTFVNNGAILLRVCIAAAGTVTITFPFIFTREGQLPAPFSQVLSNSVNYIFGPFSPTSYNDANGLVNVTFPFATGNTVGLYTLPAART